MTDRKRVRHGAGSLLILVILLSTGYASAFEIGGFDDSRGNLGSFVDGMGSASPEALRLAVQANFPNMIISGAPLLTAEYLSGVQVVLLSVWSSSSSGITPLSAAEQSALYDFVLGGGCAMIFVDNHDLDDESNESLLDPFGLDVMGKINQYDVVGTFIDPASCPATMGPFGTLTAYTVDVPGWFDVIGPHAVALDVLPTGQSSLAYIDFGVLGPDSGAVLLCSDTSHIMGLYLDDQTVDLVSNMIAAFMDQAVGIPDREISDMIMAGSALHQAKPNPFNPQTMIAFDLESDGAVSLCVYDVAGHLVDVLLEDQFVRKGRNEVVWRGTDQAGRQLSSGTYFLRLETDHGVGTRKVMLAK